MVPIRRWESFAELKPMERDAGRLRGPRLNLLRDGYLQSGWGRVPVNVYEKGDQLVVKARLPGLKPEDLDVTVDNDILTITGETKSVVPDEHGNYLHREWDHGPFRRSLHLPKALDSSKAESTYNDGVLKITFPKREEFKPRQLKITIGKDSNDKKGS